MGTYQPASEAITMPRTPATFKQADMARIFRVLPEGYRVRVAYGEIIVEKDLRHDVATIDQIKPLASDKEVRL
jgi:hypothetical protein